MLKSIKHKLLLNIDSEPIRMLVSRTGWFFRRTSVTGAVMGANDQEAMILREAVKDRILRLRRDLKTLEEAEESMQRAFIEGLRARLKAHKRMKVCPKCKGMTSLFKMVDKKPTWRDCPWCKRNGCISPIGSGLIECSKKQQKFMCTEEEGLKRRAALQNASI